MRRGPLTPPPPQRRVRLDPFDRRFQRFYARLTERRESVVYELRDPWMWDRLLRAGGDDDAG